MFPLLQGCISRVCPFVGYVGRAMKSSRGAGFQPALVGCLVGRAGCKPAPLIRDRFDHIERTAACGGVRGVDGLLEAELAVDRASTRVVLLYFEGEFTAASLFRFREDRVEQQATDASTTQRRFHKEVANVDQGLGGERRETAEASSDADRLITMKSEKDQ